MDVQEEIYQAIDNMVGRRLDKQNLTTQSEGIVVGSSVKGDGIYHVKINGATYKVKDGIGLRPKLNDLVWVCIPNGDWGKAYICAGKRFDGGDPPVQNYVQANPTDLATDTLRKLKVNKTTYEIPRDVTDVKVNGVTVVSNKVANVPVPVQGVYVDGHSVLDENGIAQIERTSSGVNDVIVDGDSVVDSHGDAIISMPTIPVIDVQVDNVSVMNGTVAKIDSSDFGTKVIPNPSQTATEDLNKVKIDNTVYKIAGGTVEDVLVNGVSVVDQQGDANISINEIKSGDSIPTFATGGDGTLYLKLKQGSSIGTFKYLKFEVTGRKGGGNDVTQFSMLTLLNESNQVVAWPSNITWATNVSVAENRPITSGGKLCATGGLPTVTFTFPDDEKLDLDEVVNYSWYTANDQPARDPVSWNLYVSNDGTNWTLIDKRLSETITDTRNVIAFTSDKLNSLSFNKQIENIYYNIDDNWVKDSFGTGSVEANPAETPTNTLTSIKIDDVVYDISSGSGGQSYICDLLFENDPLPSPESGTANTTRTYTLSNSINNYDAVMVTSYGQHNSQAARSEGGTILVLKADYNIGTSDEYDKEINTSWGDQTKILAFSFPDDTTIKTHAGRLISGNEPILYKVYGLRFAASVINNPVYLNTIYDETERQVGYYYGKPLYQKTWDINVSAPSANTWYSTGILLVDYDVDTIVDGEIVDICNQSIPSVVGMMNDTHFGVNTYVPNRTLTKLTARYTKTTDQVDPNPQMGNIIYLPSVYSEEERQVGVHNDGRPLYQKTWFFSTPITVSDNSWIESPILLSSINANRIVKAEASQPNGVANVQLQAALQGSSSSQYVRLMTSRNNGNEDIGDLTLQYTKTTDQPGSAFPNISWPVTDVLVDDESVLDGTVAKFDSSDFGTTVIANPVENATDELVKLQVGDDIYKLSNKVSYGTVNPTTGEDGELYAKLDGVVPSSTYRYIKFEIISNQSNYKFTFMGTFHFTDKDDNIMDWPSGTVCTCSVNCNESHGPNQFISNTVQDYVQTYNTPASFTITLPENEPLDILTYTKYTWRTDNNISPSNPMYVPKTWKLYLSNDAINWLEVDSVTDFQITKSYSAYQTVFLDRMKSLPTRIPNITEMYINSQGYWCKDISGGATELSELTDTSLSSPTDGQILKYDSVSEKWINAKNTTYGVINPTGGNDGDLYLKLDGLPPMASYRYIKFEILTNQTDAFNIEFDSFAFVDENGNVMPWPQDATATCTVNCDGIGATSILHSRDGNYVRTYGNPATFVITLPENNPLDILTYTKYTWGNTMNTVTPQYPGSLPKSWNLYLSNDGTTWTKVDSVTDFPITQSYDPWTTVFLDEMKSLPSRIPNITDVYVNSEGYWCKSDFGNELSLSDLTDTTISSPTAAQPLTYDATNSVWVNGGIIPAANGGTGNNSGYVRAGQKANTTIGANATAEGYSTTASGTYSHAEGASTTASGMRAHAEGYNTVASADCSHASGNSTVAGYANQFVAGKLNSNKSTSIFEIGIGVNASSRRNGLELDTSGNLKTAGTITDGNGNVLGSSSGNKVFTWDSTYTDASTSNFAVTLSEMPSFSVGDILMLKIHANLTYNGSNGWGFLITAGSSTEGWSGITKRVSSASGYDVSEFTDDLTRGTCLTFICTAVSNNVPTLLLMSKETETGGGGGGGGERYRQELIYDTPVSTAGNITVSDFHDADSLTFVLGLVGDGIYQTFINEVPMVELKTGELVFIGGTLTDSNGHAWSKYAAIKYINDTTINLFDVNGHYWSQAGYIYRIYKNIYAASVINNPVYLSDIYSEEERQVGYWRDGKPLYQVTQHYSSVTKGTTNTINHGIQNVDTIFCVDANCKYDGRDEVLNLPYISTNSNYHITFSNITDTYFMIAPGSGFVSVEDLEVTFQYTKTTDVPEQNPTLGNIIYLPSIYSEEERQVGVDMDGRPLYQRTYKISVDHTSTASYYLQSYAHGISNMNLDSVRFEASIIANSGTVRPLVFNYGTDDYGSAVWNGNVFADNTYILFELGKQIRANTDRIVVTIQYTKTTDTPGSGIWTPDGNLSHHYSTTEHIIGTWIDGSTLYERTIQLTADLVTSDSSWTPVQYNNQLTNIGTLIDCKRVNDTASYLTDRYTNNNGVLNAASKQSGTILRSGSYLTLQYTKSS